ncbi:DUF523 domain-containing protein [Kaarinaea lacus]
MPNRQSNKIQIAVSSCLLGHKVRYDGQDRKNKNVLKLCEQFHCIAICPEYAIGLGIPREPINVVLTGSDKRVRGIENPNHDVTEALQEYADSIHESIPTLCGYVFKSRSPSCGVNSTPFFSETGTELGIDSGIYSSQIKQRRQDLPIVEETQLTTGEDIQRFIDAVNTYAAGIST